MTLSEEIITIAAVVAGTMVTRFLPFVLFPANKKTPPLVVFLGKMLPTAVMGMLVVYSLKDTQLLGGYHGLPEAIAVALTVLLQATVRNLLLTIAAGTISYMLLVQYIFV
ncbi:branched-chain amino acid transporter permease [uncultured Phascolarctobacterium sp.]|uniref:branched-chain amino acid transporter permease n=1 Tax=uncultured Phascolarctobacterium sp. TaxID=512296 RepID=UPI0025CF8822|nr:AzlD domain-containing protein [uncultured Phascolarctobacterium sp.]